MHLRLKFFLLAALLPACFALTACTQAAGDGQTLTYSGPGSHYVVNSVGNTYTIKKFANPTATATDFVVTATALEVYGYKKFTVTAMTGTSAPAVGSTFYGLEVPGFAQFIQPINTAAPDQVIASVISGSCPKENLAANWIKVKTGTNTNMSNPSSDIYGTFQYLTTGVASLPSKYNVNALTTSLGSQTFSSATCANGVMSVVTSGTDTATMYLTNNGGAIVNTSNNSDSNAEFIFGMPAAELSGTDFTATYSGFVYMGGQSSGSKLKPIKFTLTGTSTGITGTGYTLSDVSTDTVSSGSASLNITAINTPSNGLMIGTLTTPSGTSKVACMGVFHAKGSDKQMINCAGVDPSATANLFNFLLVSR